MHSKGIHPFYFLPYTVAHPRTKDLCGAQKEVVWNKLFEKENFEKKNPNGSIKTFLSNNKKKKKKQVK